jgi:CheY-like chemotaxis protein
MHCAPTISVRNDARLAMTAAFHGGGDNGSDPDSSARHARSDESLHLLVADDSNADRALLAAYLQSAGWSAVMVYNGKDAAFCAGSERYDAIVLEQNMPAMTGIEVAMQCRRQQGPNANTPILIWTASDLTLLAPQVEDLPRVDLAAKPLAYRPFLDWAQSSAAQTRRAFRRTR